MDPRFNEIFTQPENSIFQVVFYPDRIYHAQYLNATRSDRYRYNVQEVRSKQDLNVLKGEVYLDGQFLSNFVRIEYRSSHLVELAREKGRFLRQELLAFVKVIPENGQNIAESMVKLLYSPWIDAYQVEIWETLEPPTNNSHDFKVLDMMGYQKPITRIPAFNPALRDIKALKQLELAVRENDRDLPFGYTINNPAWDNDYERSYQVPNTPQPSSNLNTVKVDNYLINFQRGWFIQSEDVEPVRYLNALMQPNNPDFDTTGTNVIEMRWIVQRDLGSSLVFFHEVTIPPGKVEGTHRHIGSEELYYIVEGTGIAYLGVGDDPKTDHFPTVTRDIFGIGKKECKELPVKPGSVIYTKSGGIHGIRNPGNTPLKFIAFLYHSS
ncbi:cupin domain-containing protein [Aphanothece sacrum]|uniref:Cupin n=1 Tax=Aphanothece sacrum FPU1 TaxID=1920663 RepID=A0A401IMR0_APHSA|nr:cupin domain-containing protein [Aphanothece sacrum]GBF82537.1 cupin [Aphanothece sacrum FPU1]GBF84671.1 cupin [Aphanothece sacrum FPU3]